LARFAERHGSGGRYVGLMAALIDWSVAERTACSLAPSSPPVTPDEAAAVVAELLRCAEEAATHVARLTHLSEPDVTAETRVVDRPGWIAANTASMSSVMDPLTNRLAEAHPPGRITAAIGGRATGAQAGAVLAFLSGKVLGQFEFFSAEKGQLLLVAPNVVSVEQSLKVHPADFRLWVCLHEVTHRVQFSAVAWMRQHMLDEISALTQAIDVEPGAMLDRLRSGLSELVKTARNGSDRHSGEGLIAAFAPPEAREILDRVTGFMSLVEGHAEYVMNAVEPGVIPSQPEIERKFAERRRRGANPFDRLMRNLLGLDAKTRQYTQGSAFVRQVVDRIGLDSFNAVWAGPSNLPTKVEITNPAHWIKRVHG